MSEIHITIGDVSEKEREGLLKQVKSTVCNYNPCLKVTVSEPFLDLFCKGGYYRLYYLKCRYIETDKRYLIFHCENREFRTFGKISDLSQKLPPNIFFRCNNSYIVNLQYISEIVPEGDRYNIHLLSGEVIPLSRSRYREYRNNLKPMQKY